LSIFDENKTIEKRRIFALFCKFYPFFNKFYNKKTIEKRRIFALFHKFYQFLIDFFKKIAIFIQ
jgi:hypothetical protein